MVCSVLLRLRLEKAEWLNLSGPRTSIDLTLAIFTSTLYILQKFLDSKCSRHRLMCLAQKPDLSTYMVWRVMVCCGFVQKTNWLNPSVIIRV